MRIELQTAEERREQARQAAIERGRSWERAYEAYDYIMNTRLAYEALGAALGYLERRAKRQGIEVLQEVRFGADNLTTPQWFAETAQALALAVEDYRREFGEDPDWFGRVDPKKVLELAYEQRDRWDRKALAQQKRG